MQKSDGMTYAPKGKPTLVCGPGEFQFAAVALDHGHIYGMSNGLLEAGGHVKWVWDPVPERLAAYQRQFPSAKAARSLDEVLEDDAVHLVAAAAVPNLRGPLGCRVMRAGKDYFTDKTPFTKLSQLAEARTIVADTGKKYAVYYSERLHSECATFAGELVAGGAIGRVIQVIGLGPHRLNAAARPGWFFEKEKYGGILTDIGSHQVEQFLYYTGSTDATVTAARVGNFANPEYPELEDFGEANLLGNTGASQHFRVDWLTPDGLGTWGDGRTILLGTEGYIEMRKYINVGTSPAGDNLYLVTKTEEKHYEVAGQAGYPFFGRLIRDVLDRTETAMTQTHAFKAAELCLLAQDVADQPEART